MLLREWMGEAHISVPELHEFLEPAHFTDEEIPSTRKLYDVLTGRGLTRELAEAVVDVCTETAQMQQMRLSQVRQLIKAAEDSPTPALAGESVYRSFVAGRNSDGVPALTQHRDRLEDYLLAARRAASEHPYPGIVPGTTQPLLNSVYRPQLARRYRPGHDDRVQAAQDAVVSLPAMEILRLDKNCVIFAGPGAGKSCLLRIGLAAAVDRCRSDASAPVPILVTAADLAAHRLPLAEALASAATADLSPFGLSAVLAADIFRNRPTPRTRWLVLVDGLDEITDTQARRKLLTTLAANSEPASSLYQFIVTTRPLPDQELDVFSGSVQRYELQPLAEEDLLHFAEQWLDALGLPQPEAAAVAFSSALKRSRLTDLTRIPLMMALLCQLHAADPDRGLPAGRTEIYQRFTDLLHERLYADGSSGITDQVRAALKRYGPHALDRAHRTLDHLSELIAYLAAQRRSGNSRPALEVVAAQGTAKRPAGVTPHVWTMFLDESLRRSGLLTVRGGDFVFLHQTLQEYLAARHTAADVKASTQAFIELRDRSWESKRSRRGADQRSYSASYIGFLLDAWEGTALADEKNLLLERIACQKSLSACSFIADQAGIGTLVPDRAVTAATDSLAGFTDSHFEHSTRVLAAEALVKIGDPRGLPFLQSFAADSTVSGPARLAAAESLSGDLGANMLATLVTDLALHYGVRAEAAKSIARRRDPHTADLIAELTKEPSTHAEIRMALVSELHRRGDPRVRGILANLVSDSELNSHVRGWAAEHLSGLGDPRAQDLLAELANDCGVNQDVRLRVAWALILKGDIRGSKLIPVILANLAGTDDRSSTSNDAALRNGPRPPHLRH